MKKNYSELREEFKRIKEFPLKKQNEIPTISISQVKDLFQKYNLSPKEIEIFALQEEIIPTRYARNFDSLSFSEQIKLLNSRAAVVGCGGLGGSIIELLARLGVGNIVVVDGDIFKESNLNRQVLCNEDNLAKEKVLCAAARIKQINSSINSHSYSQFIDDQNISDIINGIDVVVDGLDNIPSRFLLERACKELGKVFIHGAIHGLQGQISTIFPEDKGLISIYGPKDRYLKMSNDEQVSVLAVTPALVASLQVTEVLKVLLHRGNILRNKLLLVNLEYPEFNILNLS
ncbi:MAG TPA: HesA/MoeB/ThiF family protein [Atribacterota bacterium]|nr:HesA/MoeB/ThiF family protein [Atribacterota bacterium]